jgi:RNA polymerase sigma-70 factor, ECF subfamily
VTLGDGHLEPVAPSDDPSLVRRVQAGDSGAYGTIYERYHPALARIAAGYTYDADIIADLVHDSFLKFLTAIKEGRYQERGQLKQYLYRLCARICLDHVRSAKHRLSHPHGLGQPGDPLHVAHTTRQEPATNEALDLLLEEERRVAAHRLVEAIGGKEGAALVVTSAGLTMRQASVALDTTISAMKARLWRARAMAEVLVLHDPEFDAIKPERYERRRLGPSALPVGFSRGIEGADADA